MLQILHEAGALNIKALKNRCLAAVTAEALREECNCLPMQSRDPGKRSPLHTSCLCWLLGHHNIMLRRCNTCLMCDVDCGAGLWEQTAPARLNALYAEQGISACVTPASKVL